MFQHFIITRFNVKGAVKIQVPINDTIWIKHRFSLFKKFCFPSLENQTNKDFVWLVFFDENTPNFIRKEVEKLQEKFAQLKLFYIQLFDNKTIVATTKQFVKHKTKFLITTRIDSDDVFNKNFINQIQHDFVSEDKLFLNYINGYTFNYKKLYFRQLCSNPFISMIEKNQDFKTVFINSHNKLSQHGQIKNILTKPMWIQIIHEKNLTNKLVGVRTSLKNLDHFIFDMDINKIKEKKIQLCFERQKNKIGKLIASIKN